MHPKKTMKIGEQEKQYLRNIRIHKLLNISDRGRRINMRCPIHGGSNPQAFHVYPDNSYYCFNCRAHGTGAIDFVMAVDGCSFNQAVEQLLDYI